MKNHFEPGLNSPEHKVTAIYTPKYTPDLIFNE